MPDNQPQHTSDNASFLTGGGEMGQLIRSLNWAGTSLGDPDSWPMSLKFTAGMLLSSRFPMLICWGPDYIQLYNDAFRPILGESKHPQAMGISARETFAEIWETIGPMFEDVMKGQAVGFPDFMVPLNRNGYVESCYFDFSYNPIRDERGNVGGVLVICTETTEKVTALQQLETRNQQLNALLKDNTLSQKKLTENEANLRLIILQAPVAIAIFRGPQYVVEIVNERALELWGRKKDEVLNKPILEAMAELQEQGIKELLDHVYQTAEPFSATELPVQLVRNGHLETAYINFAYEPLYDADRNINGLITIGTEVTGQVIQQQQLKLSEQKLDQILSKIPVPVVVLRGSEHIIETINQSLLAFWNKGSTEVLGKPMLEVFPELKSQPFPNLWKQVLETGENISNYEKPVTFNTASGGQQLYYVDYHYQPVTDADGKRTGVLATIINVTDKVESRRLLEESGVALMAVNEEMASANEELAVTNEELASTNEELAETQENLQKYIARLYESEEKLRQAIETGKMGTWSINPVTLQITMSAFVKELLGLRSTGNVEMEEVMRAIHPDYHQMLNTALSNAMQNHQASDTEYPINNLLTGEQKWVRATGKVFTDANGNATEYSGMFMDITERKLDELRKNDFIGMVSHELKTPLTSLTAIVQVLNSKLKNSEDSFIASALDKANIQAKKMSNMINGFLNISRLESGKIQLNKELFKLDELLRDIIAETGLTSSHQIALATADPVIVFADKDKIGSVIANLLSNAVKYSSKGSAIEVKYERKNKQVEVTVKDEGIGIKQRDIKQLFDRYYRVESKNTAHISGFGIGLYLSAEIIQRHEGKIWVESEEGKGSVFYFSLPLIS